MARKIALFIYAVMLVAIISLALNAPAFRSPTQAVLSVPAAQATEVEEPTTVTEPPSTILRTDKSLAEMAAIAAAAATSTTISSTTTTMVVAQTTTTTQAPATTTTARAAPVTTVTTSAPFAEPASTCSRLDVNLAAATLTARCSGGVVKTMPISSGSGEWYTNPSGKREKADTPTGSYSVYYKDPGWVEAPLGWMYNSLYFLDGFAIHGDPLVPSHGCIHVTEDMADWLFDRVAIGTIVSIK